MLNFLKRPHASKYPAYLGYTVYKSEYDAVVAECNRAHELNVQLQNRVNVLEGSIVEDLLTIDTLRQELDAANDTIEKLSIENDVLHQAAAKRKPKPRETGVRP